MNSDDRERRVEQWLDTALSHYSDVQPRPGLERRILTNLEARQRVRRRWSSWRWAPAFAVLILAAALVWITGRPEERVVVQAPTPPQRTENAGLNPQIIRATPPQVHPDAAPSAVQQQQYRIELLIVEMAGGKAISTHTHTATLRGPRPIAIDTALGPRVRVSARENTSDVILAGDATLTHATRFRVTVHPGVQTSLALVDDPTVNKQYRIEAILTRIP